MLLERTRLKEDSVAIRDETIRHETLGNAQDKRRLGKFRNVDSRLTRSRSSFANNELNISTIENPFAQLANLTTITPNVMLFSTITNSHAVRKNFDIEGGLLEGVDAICLTRTGFRLGGFSVASPPRN